MDSERGLTLPISGDNSLKRFEARIFPRNITHSTKIPNVKSRLDILWGYSTGFGKVIK
jgi:hypothetical protein